MMLKHPGLKSLYFVLLLWLAGLQLHGQELDDLEQQLILIHKDVVGAPTEPERFAANDEFIRLLDEALALDTRMRYGFDSINTLSILTSNDKQLRVFSWFVPHQNGSYTYYGVIQSWNRRYKRYETHWLEDKSEEISDATYATLEASGWYGALYYDIIEVARNGKKYYTMLAWDGNNPLVRRKLIDVITLRESGAPVFGYPMFRNYDHKARRVIFEYSAKASMTLRFEEQRFYVRKRNRKRKVRIKEVKDDMIVFDRLSPLDPSMKSNPAFIVPETNIVDAFILSNGRWTMIRNIDARNPEDDPNNGKPGNPGAPQRGLFPDNPAQDDNR